MAKLYPYVGPLSIATRLAGQEAGWPIHSSFDIRRWIRRTGQVPDQQGQVTATFVIDEYGTLRIADRRSEHVACSGGKPVLSAGEITFALTPNHVNVEWVTNQSTGFCPEPESWPAVAAALSGVGIEAPLRFSQEFAFRRCTNCGTVNIVKDNYFVCEVCSTGLPAEWNVSPNAVQISS